MISATTTEFSGGSRHANVVFDNGPKMVSLSIDNSCGKMSVMARADIRLLFSDPLRGGIEDVTNQVFGGGEADIVRGTIENMDKAMKWLQLQRWGFQAL
jgi:hypothetical protein